MAKAKPKVKIRLILNETDCEETGHINSFKTILVEVPSNLNVDGYMIVGAEWVEENGN